MPRDVIKEAYPEPPTQTPVPDRQTSVPNPVDIAMKAFDIVIDRPVTTFRGILDSFRSWNKTVYYHQEFRRVPDLTECDKDDYVCQYEAEMQWRRDFKVDQEILIILRERYGACIQREGTNARQNCAFDKNLLAENSRNYGSRYQDLGAYANARKCLMKQKERMMAAEAQKA